ncbi:DUF721 domain-containing protein [Enterobacter kobei]|uniref:DUF721 domain-containing protein n=1 Tax=Enterobacter kobei TaxID=208224 RepID=UPI0021BF752D|nr:DciA family protein [Enterobacter kobei]UXJ66685.1 DciA family protein [Enterobacter kobei]
MAKEGKHARALFSCDCSVVDEGDHQLQRIKQRASKLLRLDREVKQHLPGTLSRWVRVANYRNSTLILEVRNAAVNLKLRQALPGIERELKSGLLPSMQSIEVRVNPDVGESMEKAGTVNILSENSAELIAGIAEMASDELKQALERLAAHKRTI